MGGAVAQIIQAAVPHHRVEIHLRRRSRLQRLRFVQRQGSRTDRNRETAESVGSSSAVPELCKRVCDYIFSHMDIMHVRIGKGDQAVLVFGKQSGEIR